MDGTAVGDLPRGSGCEPRPVRPALGPNLAPQWRRFPRSRGLLRPDWAMTSSATQSVYFYQKADGIG